MKTYRVLQSGELPGRIFEDVPALCPEHAKLIARAVHSGPSSEIVSAEEFNSDWVGSLWFVFDADGILHERKDGSLMEFALEVEARESLSGLPEKDCHI